jgi:monofunctional biosynthetic peptidoglycan transglycosylase
VSRARRPLRRRLLRIAAGAVLGFLGATALPVLALRWVPPPTTAFVVERRIAAAREGRRGFAIRRRWVPRARIAPAAALAAVAAEDQTFPAHHGFDLDAVRHALADRGRGRRLRGASTITQQTAKNLFLWPGRSWVRKGLEAWFTVLLEALWPKERILEVYLNVAEFGDGIYGAEAAARAFFNKPASGLTAREAALLAAVLPSPRRMRPDRPSAYVRGRADWILGQMQHLGAGHLRGAW